MDEGSQVSKARALHAILHAANKKSLERILILGDPSQLPPTTKSPMNIFESSGKTSLFERLVKSAVEPVDLRRQ